MEYTDDEQVEKLKAWWKSYGNALIVGVVIGLGILYGGRYWTQLQVEKAGQASLLFDQLVFQTQSKAQDNKKIEQLGKQIIDEYGRTPYAGLAALIVASNNFDAGQAQQAKQQLAWAMDHAREESVRHVARIRLGRILLDEKNIENAEQLLGEGPIQGFETEFYELAGDIQKHKGDLAAAREAYAKAVSFATGADDYLNVIRMKLDELG